VDKAVLEAASCGSFVLTSNPAFDFLPFNNKLERLDLNLATQKLLFLINLSDNEKEEARLSLRNFVVKHHNLDDLAEKIVQKFYE